MRYFHDKVVWVTGASSGIGLALSHQLAARGISLVISARSEEKLNEIKEQYGNIVYVLPLDLADHDGLERMAAEAISAYGQVDILINNAGISQRSLAMETLREVESRLMDVNYFGTVWLTKAILGHMLERESGRIVVVTSVTGKFGTKLRSGYAAAKHALHGYFDALRMELYGTGVGVNVVCPGFVRTNISMNALTQDGSRQAKMDAATEAGISTEECAEQILRAIGAKPT